MPRQSRESSGTGIIRNFAAKGREAAYARPLKQVSWPSLNRSFVSRKQKRVAYDWDSNTIPPDSQTKMAPTENKFSSESFYLYVIPLGLTSSFVIQLGLALPFPALPRAALTSKQNGLRLKTSFRQSPFICMWSRWDSNPRPSEPESVSQFSRNPQCL